MRLMIITMCIVGTFFLTSCKEKPAGAANVEDFSVKKIEGDLTNSEIKTLFSTLGLSCERFSINIPQRSGLVFASERYVNGSLAGGGGKATMYVNKGLQDFMICKTQQGSEYKISIHNSGASSTFGSGDLQDNGATTWSLAPVSKITNEKQPIFFFAANTSGIEGYSYNSADFHVEDFAQKYEFAMVIYVALEEK